MKRISVQFELKIKLVGVSQLPYDPHVCLLVSRSVVLLVFMS